MEKYIKRTLCVYIYIYIYIYICTYAHIYITESLCCIAEINNTVNQLYVNKKFKNSCTHCYIQNKQQGKETALTPCMI